jgi:hypothetical protein
MIRRDESRIRQGTYHQLLKGRPNGNEEPLPCLNSLSKLETVAGREEISVLPETETSLRSMLLKDEVQSRDNRERVIVPSIRIRIQVPEICLVTVPNDVTRGDKRTAYF